VNIQTQKRNHHLVVYEFKIIHGNSSYLHIFAAIPKFYPGWLNPEILEKKTIAKITHPKNH